MTALLLGTVVVVAIFFLLKWYTDADVKKIKASAKWTGVTILVIGIAVLAATGRLGAAIALLMGFAVWAMRVFQMFSMARHFGGMFRTFGFGAGLGAGGPGPGASQVTSAFFDMSLDLGSGHMDGVVTAGRAKGKRLSGMGLAELTGLLQEVGSDPDSAQLLEAFLDRNHPDWRETTNAGPAGPPPASSGAMTRDEAYRILGLPDGAGAPEIKTAYRRLMAQMHPDKGGSDYLAAKVNQAKDFLLKGTSV